MLLDEGLWDTFQSVDSGVLNICVPLISTIYNNWTQMLSSCHTVFVSITALPFDVPYEMLDCNRMMHTMLF